MVMDVIKPLASCPVGTAESGLVSWKPADGGVLPPATSIAFCSFFFFLCLPSAAHLVSVFITPCTRLFEF